jgi:hypothetical protein
MGSLDYGNAINVIDLFDVIPHNAKYQLNENHST